MKRSSEASNRLLGQAMFKVLALVQELERRGTETVHFEIGDPDFATPDNISNAACAAILNGETHYASSMGIHEFRLASCNTTVTFRKFRPGPDWVPVTPGACYSNGCSLRPRLW